MQADANSSAREFDLVVFDNDGTLNLETSCWRRVHEAFGTYESIGRRLLEHHLEKRTPYDEYASENLTHWKGHHKKEFLDIIRAIQLREGAMDVLHYLRQQGYKIGVVSSGFMFWKDRFRDEFSIEFDFYRANEILFDEKDICTGEIILNTTDNVPGKDKGSIIKRESSALGIPLKRTVMVGDGWGDVVPMKLAARAYCVGDNFPEVHEAADEWLGDSLLPLIGKL
jgi:HAD superfamily phosphoserine phosphatase-like hydrolase